jgi:subtilase family serine protease
VLPRPQRWIPPIVVCLLALLTGLGLGATRAAAGSPRSARLVRVGRAPVLPPGTQALAGAASATQRLRVTVALRPRDSQALAADAAAVENPSSPDYRHYLSPQQFATRFGATDASITAVQRALRTAGLRPGAVGANHLSLQVVAGDGAYERAFHLVLARMALPSRRTVLVNLAAPALPASVAPDVQAIIGLDGLQSLHSTRERPRATGLSPAPRPATATTGLKQSHQSPEACPAASTAASQQGAYTADQIATAYQFNGLYGAGDEGAGVNIGVYELEPNLTSDIAAYQACYGTSTPVSYTAVDGGSGTGAGSGEAAFDIEQIIGLAPKANVIVYQGPNSNSDDPGSGPYDIFATMISQDKVSIISNSWGECEAQEGATDAHAENTLFEEAAIQGQSVISAAGDYGSEDCDGATESGASTLAVDDPGSQPYVTDVGGTSLTALGPPPTQTTWDSGGSVPLLDLNPGAGAGGGGISSFWTMPTYQSSAPPGLNVVNADSSPAPCGSVGDCREVPDVSADADPAHGYLIYYNGDHSEAGQMSGWQASGGTSGAAPLWAAVFAEADADAACAGTPIGFANPALYRAAASSPSTFFGDVTSGDNDFTGAGAGRYPATPGYDMATGLGSPNVTALAPQLCAESLRLTAPASLQSFVHRSRTLRVSTADAGASVTVAVSGLPRGVAFDPSTGEISGTPVRAGAATVTVSAVDSFGAVRLARFHWDVAAPPTLSHLSLTGAAAALPVLSLRISSGRAETPLSAVAVQLPAGLRLTHRAQLTVTALADGARIGAVVSGSGAAVKLALKRSAAAVVLRFGPGTLTEAGTVRAAARRALKPIYHVTVVVRDSAGAVSHLSGSARVAT